MKKKLTNFSLNLNEKPYLPIFATFANGFKC